MVQIEEPDNDYHVIATLLRPRNDEVGEAVLLFSAEWLMGAGREGHDPPLQRNGKISKNQLTIQKFMLKYAVYCNAIRKRSSVSQIEREGTVRALAG